MPASFYRYWPSFRFDLDTCLLSDYWHVLAFRFLTQACFQILDTCFLSGSWHLFAFRFLTRACFQVIDTCLLSGSWQVLAFRFLTCAFFQVLDTCLLSGHWHLFAFRLLIRACFQVLDMCLLSTDVDIHRVYMHCRRFLGEYSTSMLPELKFVEFINDFVKCKQLISCSIIGVGI